MNWITLPVWSPRVIVAVTTVLLVAGLLRWRRERRGTGPLLLRLLLILGLAGVLFNPNAFLPRQDPGRRKLVVLIDTSASMATRDVNSESRLWAALKVLKDPAARARLERSFDLETRTFDRGQRPARLDELKESAAQGDATDTGSALNAAIADLGETASSAGILLVSDGRATEPGAEEAAQLALAKSVPLWVWPLGGVVPRRDLWVETPTSEALSFSGAEVDLSATLHAEGYSNRTFQVEVLQDGRRVVVQEVLPGTNGTGRILAHVTAPASGEQRILFRALPQPDEADSANNERAVFLRSVGARARVLIAEAQPHWDTKFLVQSLKRDPRIDLTAVYRLNATRHLALVSTTGSETRVEKDLFPRTAAAMNGFDVIILGRGADAFFDAETEALLTDFVARRGGALVFSRGRAYGARFQPLAKLEPVAWGSGSRSPVKLRPTPLAREHPIFDLGAGSSIDDILEKLPALDQASVTLGEKPLAIPLAAAEGSEGPLLLAYQRYGQGKVMSLNASGLWRWAFRESGQSESEEAYRRFWLSVLQWMLAGNQFQPGANVALTSGKRYYSSAQPMEFLIATRNLERSLYHPRITIEGGGRRLEVEPVARGETFVAEAGPFPPGPYRVTLHNNIGQPDSQSLDLEVVNASVERRDLSADAEGLERLAHVSGGAVVGAAEVARMDEVLRRWDAGRQLGQRQQPVWDKGWVLAVLLGLMVAEMWWRRRAGLL